MDLEINLIGATLSIKENPRHNCIEVLYTNNEFIASIL